MRVVCTICTELFETHSSVSALVACGHTFHEVCLSKWLEQSNTCPQCRGKVTRKGVINRLFFTESDENNGAPDVTRLENQLHEAKAKIREQQVEVASHKGAANNAKEHAVALEQNLDTMKLAFKKERTRSATLEKELSVQRVVLQEAEVCRRRTIEIENKLQRYVRLEQMLEGCEGDITEKVNNSSTKDLATWCVVIQRELARKKMEYRKLENNYQTMKRETSVKIKSFQDSSAKIARFKESVNGLEEDKQYLERENASLRKKIDVLMEQGVSSKRFIAESPAPMPSAKKPKLSLTPPEPIPFDLNENTHMTKPHTLTPSTAQKGDCEQYGTTFIKISSAANQQKVKKAVAKDITNNIAGLSQFNILKKNSRMESTSSIRKGYNGMGGHEKFVTATGFKSTSQLGKKKNKNIFKPPTTISREPPLPTLKTLIALDD